MVGDMEQFSQLEAAGETHDDSHDRISANLARIKKEKANGKCAAKSSKNKDVCAKHRSPMNCRAATACEWVPK